VLRWERERERVSESEGANSLRNWYSTACRWSLTVLHDHNHFSLLVSINRKHVLIQHHSVHLITVSLIHSFTHSVMCCTGRRSSITHSLSHSWHGQYARFSLIQWPLILPQLVHRRLVLPRTAESRHIRSSVANANRVPVSELQVFPWTCYLVHASVLSSTHPVNHKPTVAVCQQPGWSLSRARRLASLTVAVDVSSSSSSIVPLRPGILGGRRVDCGAVSVGFNGTPWVVRQAPRRLCMRSCFVKYGARNGSKCEHGL